MKTYTVAVLGATGAVGQEMLKILAERNFPVGKLIPLASARSAGRRAARVISGTCSLPSTRRGCGQKVTTTQGIPTLRAKSSAWEIRV